MDTRVDRTAGERRSDLRAVVDRRDGRVESGLRERTRIGCKYGAPLELHQNRSDPQWGAALRSRLMGKVAIAEPAAAPARNRTGASS